MREGYDLSMFCSGSVLRSVRAGKVRKDSGRTRKISAFNAFQKLHVTRNLTCKVGSLEHRRLNKNVSQEWAALSWEQKHMYQLEADKMQKEREDLQRVGLRGSKSSVEEASQCSQNLSATQVRRLNTNRLDKTLQSVASHSCWDQGLALWDHNAGLRGSLVQVPRTVREMDVATRYFQQAFAYDADIIPNPQPSPVFLRPCCVKHAGTCACDSSFDTFSELTSQFNAGLQRQKLGGAALLVHWQPVHGVGDGHWFLLAGVCLRPLCHSMVSLYQQGIKLRLVLDSGSMRIGSAQQRLRGLIQEFKASGADVAHYRVQAQLCGVLV